jgi:large-conductance mechanosensitive channel
MARARQRRTSQTHVVTAGTTIKFEQPKSGRSKDGVAKIVVQEINPVSGFVDFLREHAIVGLSIGFILGTQMAAFVKVLVESFIDPLTKLMFGMALSKRTFTLEFHGRVAKFGWGNVAYNLLIILLLLFFIYAIIKLLKLDKFDKPAEKDKK